MSADGFIGHEIQPNLHRLAVVRNEQMANTRCVRARTHTRDRRCEHGAHVQKARWKSKSRTGRHDAQAGRVRPSHKQQPPDQSTQPNWLRCLFAMPIVATSTRRLLPSSVVPPPPIAAEPSPSIALPIVGTSPAFLTRPFICVCQDPPGSQPTR